VIQHFLELGGCGSSVMREQVGLATHVRGVQICFPLAQFVGSGSFQIRQ
jgi:hypothetical protein